MSGLIDFKIMIINRKNACMKAFGINRSQTFKKPKNDIQTKTLAT